MGSALAQSKKLGRKTPAASRPSSFLSQRGVEPWARHQAHDEEIYLSGANLVVKAREIATERAVIDLSLADMISLIDMAQTTAAIDRAVVHMSAAKVDEDLHQNLVPLEPIYERLEDLSQLEDGWDGDAARVPTSRAISTSSRLIAAAWDQFQEACPNLAQPYEVMPIVDGGLQLEWRGQHDRVALNVGPEGVISFLHVVRHGDTLQYQEGDDLSLIDALKFVRRVIGA